LISRLDDATQHAEFKRTQGSRFHIREIPTLALRHDHGVIHVHVKPATYLPALVAIAQTSIIGPKVGQLDEFRKLTPGEAARLQGIPCGTSDRAAVTNRAAYKQLGNVVIVGVVALAARALMGHRWPLNGQVRKGKSSKRRVAQAAELFG
jgi:site-specific DNA-cytosine methylase